MIEIQNATKRFGSLAALEHLNLQIKPGCIYGLVGPNGSGKSTFAKLVNVINYAFFVNINSDITTTIASYNLT